MNASLLPGVVYTFFSKRLIGPILTISLGFALFVTPQANAALTVFTDRAIWEAAIGGVPIVENFNSVTPLAMSTGVNSAGLIDIELFGSPTDNRIDNGSGFANIDGSNYYHGALDFGTSMAGILSQTITGFGADWVSTTTGGNLTLTIGPDTVLFTDYLGGEGDGFLGVISTVAFSTITLDTADGVAEQFGMDNFTFVPIPAAAWLLGSGLLGLVGMARLMKAA